MDSFVQDVRYGLRILIKNPSFAATVVGILALGVGANTAIFSVVDAVLLARLPFDEAERLVIGRGVMDMPAGPQLRGVSYSDVLDWDRGTRALRGLSAVSSLAISLAGDQEAERVLGEIVTAGYFSTLRIEPVRGRVFSHAETVEVDAYPVVLISADLWRRRFGADPRILSGAVRLGSRDYRIIGVMPEGFHGLSMQAELWLPMAMVSAIRSPRVLEARDERWLFTVGRLHDEGTLAQAQEELDSISAAMQREFPETNAQRRLVLQTLRDSYVGNLQLTLTVLLASVGAVLLIACANVTNLLLARSAARSGELVVRQALGAGRGRLARQVLTESVTLAVCGGFAGVLVSLWAIEGLRVLIPAGLLPPYVDIHMSWRVFAFTSLVTLGSGLVFGAAPAIRVGIRDLGARLRAGGRGLGGGVVSAGIQSVVVSTQVALTAALLICAGLMARSLSQQLAVDPGFDAEPVTVFQVLLPREEYPAERRIRFVEELVEQLGRQTGIEQVALGSDAPFRGQSSAGLLWRQGDAADPGSATRYYRHSVTPRYLETLGIALVEGRSFAATDDDGSPRVALIGRAAAARLWPGGASPVGQMIRVDDADAAAAETEIIGVVDDVWFRNLTDDLTGGGLEPDVYFPYLQVPSRGVELLLRASDSRAVSPGLVRDVIRRLDPSVTVTNVAAMTDVLASQTAMTRLQSWLLAAFGGVALILGAAGIYALLAYVVARLDREIGIRLAMGATPADIVREVVIRGMTLAGMGAVAGVVLGVGAAQSMEALLFRVTSYDPVSLAAALTALLGSAFVASYMPARRASRVDPMRILRSE